MSYYVLSVKSYDDGKDDKKAFDIYSTEKEAVAAANTTFGQNLGADTIKSIMVKAFDDAGGDVVKPMFWKASALESMKYYVTVVATYSDGTETYTKNYTYDTEDESKATAHTQYGKYVGAENISTVLSTVINSVGGQPLNLTWTETTEETTE